MKTFIFIAALLGSPTVTEEFKYETMIECKVDEALFMITFHHMGVGFVVLPCHEIATPGM